MQKKGRLGIMEDVKKTTGIDTTITQRIFLIVGLGIVVACFIIVYLHDTKTMILDDPTWYKILLFSSMSTVGGYLFGSGTARK